jgi:citrate lyase beta subunit
MDSLRTANLAFAQSHPGESLGRQPVHTVYGGAQLFKSDAAQKLGAAALRSLEEYAPDPIVFARALGIDRALAEAIHPRVLDKLRREPVEDYRIDFEDGYGNRSDAEEDGHARQAAEELAKGAAAGTLPAFIGIRIKPLNEELRARSVRTLDLVVTTLVERAGALPVNFVVTLPKITILEQVEHFIELLAALEQRTGLAAGSLRFEIMVETPQLIIGGDGRSLIPRIVALSGSRLRGAHFGTYDYTAGVGITAAHQHMRHLACDFARSAMQVALAGTGVWLSDGATAVMPVPIHRRSADGPPLTTEQVAWNEAAVHRGWRLHADDIRHSLVNGFYQGWDLHPAQLPSRYGALYAFFREGLDAAGERLRNFVGKAAQATLVGDVFDDAATGQGLLNYFLRGINSGALTEGEAVERTELTVEEIRGKSFLAILANRTRR